MMDWIGQPAHDLFGFLEFLRAHEDDLQRHGVTLPEFRGDPLCLLPLGRIWYDDQQIQVALLMGLAVGIGAKEDHFPRVEAICNLLDQWANVGQRYECPAHRDWSPSDTSLYARSVKRERKCVLHLLKGFAPICTFLPKRARYAVSQNRRDTVPPEGELLSAGLGRMHGDRKALQYPIHR